MAETLLPKIGLTQQQWQTYMDATYAKEASPTQQWQSVGGAGGAYIGGFQLGAGFLQSAGYIRDRSAVGNPYAWQNANNWLKPNGEPIHAGIYNYQDFLNNVDAQRDALLRGTEKNAIVLQAAGKLPTDPAARAGTLAAAHLIGPQGYIDKGLDGVDGWKTSARSRYEYIGKAVGGGTVVPPPPPGTVVAGSGSASSTSGATGDSATGYGTNTNNPLFAGSTSISYNDLTTNYTTVDVGSSATAVAESIPLPIPNPLADFSSFNTLFTFSSLNATAINFPEMSYRRGDLGLIIFSSGGRYSEERIPTAYETPDNPAGKFDYFIDNVEILSLLAPTEETKGTKAVTVSFEVTEPYSMGQFLQSCQIASVKNAHPDYTRAPFLLTMEFKGYLPDNTPVSVQNTTRYFPIKLTSVTMSISAGGCKYKILAQTWTDQAFNDDYNILKTDTVISGASVVEILQKGENSLQSVINDRLQKIAKQDANKSYVPDEVAIVFPKEVATLGASQSTNGTQARSATSTSSTSGNSSITSRLSLTRDSKTKLMVQSEGEVSDLGKSSLGFTAARGGKREKLPDTPIEIKSIPNKKFPRNLYQPNHKKPEFSFRKETTIVNAITEILLMSEYITKAAAESPKDPMGFYDWFRIESQVYMLPPNENNEDVGIQPLLLVYRVVPYKVHESRFQSPNVTPKGYKELANETVKEYNYIYTGKNTDVLEFDLTLLQNFGTFNLADGLGTYSGPGVLSKQGKTGAAPEEVAPLIPKVQTPTGGRSGGDVATGIARQKAFPSAWKNNDGAGDADNYMTLAAKVFHFRILNSQVEKVSANMTILGDPYFLSDSGIGNFSNTKSTSKINLTDTGTMDYEVGEVDIMVNFFTPVDLNSNTGALTFPGDIDNQLEIPFSGLYTVTQVTSKFQRGKFTQTLLMMRRPNQSMIDSIESIATTGNFAAATLPDPAPRKTSGAVATPAQEEEIDAEFGPPMEAVSYLKSDVTDIDSE